MTTARERAREAAERVSTWRKVSDKDADKIADAVSDIWEPLVKEALKSLEHDTSDTYLTDWDNIYRVKELLKEAITYGT